MSRGSVKGTGYPLHSPVSPSLPLPCVTVCHHISTGVYKKLGRWTVVYLLRQNRGERHCLRGDVMSQPRGRRLADGLRLYIMSKKFNSELTLVWGRYVQ